MQEEKKRGADTPVAAAPAQAPAEKKSKVALEREERIAKHTEASDEWSKQFGGPSDPKPSILVTVATPRGRPVKVMGREFPSNEQALVNQRVLRCLVGLSRRGVCQLIIGKIKLAGKD